jgi:sulfonate transport system substrate-binding protein
MSTPTIAAAASLLTDGGIARLQAGADRLTERTVLSGKIDIAGRAVKL